MTRPNNPRRRGRPAGFTLVELLVVLLILALLLALLVPAIGTAVKKAQNARTSAEITQLAAALADFKAKYGEYPPSRILLCENGVYPTGATGNLGIHATQGSTDITMGELAQRSIAALRRFWPRMVLSTSANFNATYTASSVLGTTWYDFNGNGGTGPDAPYILEGFECLVFFLGGVPSSTGTGTDAKISMTGWSKNPLNPFDNNQNNRQAPFFEFRSERLIYLHGNIIPAINFPLINTPATTPRTVAPLIPAYLDALGSPPTTAGAHNFYAYFSANLGGGYDPNDCNYAEFSMSGNTPVYTNEAVPLPTNPNAPLILATLGFSKGDSAIPITYSPAPNPYTVSPTLNSTVKPTYQNANSFQIISAGADGLYGWGGQFDPSGKTTSLPLFDMSAFRPTTLNTPEAAAMLATRDREQDNVTNFKAGTLAE